MANPKPLSSIPSATPQVGAGAKSPVRTRGKPLLSGANVPKPARSSGEAPLPAASAAHENGNSAGAASTARGAHSSTQGEMKPPVYDIGYKRPPKKHQFKPGQSGNPKGRAKGARNIWTILQEEAQIVVSFSENGKPAKASKPTLAIRSALNKAAKGDLRALQIILKLFETHMPSSETGGRGAAAQTPTISRHEMDREILDMLGLSEHLSPSEASSDNPTPDNTGQPQN